MKLSYSVIVAAVVYTIFAIFNYFFLSKAVGYSMTMYIIGAIVVAMPIIVTKYFKTRRVKEMEKNFPVFLQDFVEAVRGGMALPLAFKSISSNEYGVLTPLVKRMAVQLDWAIPADTVLLKFAKETNSKLISRIVSTVMESHRFGGRLVETFEALSNTAVEVERLRAERRLFLNSQIVTGYIIFFVFLIVIIGLNNYLVPSLSTVSTQSLSQLSGVPSQDLAIEYREIFRNLILMQGLFAGLTVGKMSEGAAVAGLKHSIFMMVSGGLVFLILA